MSKRISNMTAWVMSADYAAKVGQLDRYLGQYMVDTGIATRAEVSALRVELVRRAEYKQLNEK